ncbi:UNVERIFIED_CONTAM: hypothetical protein RMT77_014377 [Armadillidium vulgare]
MTRKIIKNFDSKPFVPLLASGIAILHFVLVGFLCTEKSFLVSGARLRREENPENEEARFLKEIIRADFRTRPRGVNITDGEDDPTRVKVKMIIRSISDLDDHKMEFKVQVTLRCFWQDERLQFSNQSGNLPYVTLITPSNVWVPDLFFRNEKEGEFHNILLPNTYLRIYPDGNVIYSTRISVTLICPMNFRRFPFDVQKCQLPLASFSLTSRNLVLSWKNGEPLQITNVLLLKVFILQNVKTRVFVTETDTGNYSCLDVDLIFKREYANYQITVYLPCSMLVILSWITFLFDGKSFGAKVTLGITVLITLAIMTFAVNQTLPQVSYTRAIDVWTGVCLTFVFGVLLEIALISYFLSLERNNESKNKVSEEEEEAGDNAIKSQDRNQSENFPLEEDRKTEKNKGRSSSNKFLAFILTKFPLKWSSRIDFISRIVFPVFFLIFVIAYFSTYRNASTDNLYYPIHSSVKEKGYTYSVEA